MPCGTCRLFKRDLAHDICGLCVALRPDTSGSLFVHRDCTCPLYSSVHAAEPAANQKQDEPSAYAIECEPGDPKMHSLSFWKKDLEKIVTAHGGKVVPLYRRP